MTHHTLTTTAFWTDADGEDRDQDVKVVYTYYRGFNGSQIDPPEPASIEIQSVTPDVPESCYDALAVECWEDYAGYVADAAEYRASLREDY